MVYALVYPSIYSKLVTLATLSPWSDYVRTHTCLSVGPASETPKLIQYRVVLFHTPDIGLIDL